MLVTGCSNSLLTKYQDRQYVSETELFHQPVYQTVQMFIAEASVWLVVLAFRLKSSRTHGYKPITVAETGTEVHSNTSTATESEKKPLQGQKVWLLALPASCDICATTLMNVGLLVTPVSIFQMVRGAIVLFVAGFSVVFLKKQLSRKQWLGLSLVTSGVFIVGLSAATFASDGKQENKSSWGAMYGVLMILLAQVFTASQFVLEEFILSKYSLDPIKVVSWEGTFGALITIVISLVVYSVTKLKTFDLLEGTTQVLNNHGLLISSIAILFSLAAFNVSGLTVTRLISATSRSTIDTCRTLGIWFVSLLIGWETFEALQLLGFALLVYGTLIFNQIVHCDKADKVDKSKREPGIEIQEFHGRSESDLEEPEDNHGNFKL